jgi:hypothetical protein
MFGLSIAELFVIVFLSIPLIIFMLISVTIPFIISSELIKKMLFSK